MSGHAEVADPPAPRKRPIRLHTARDARKLLAKIANGVWREELDVSRATCMTYVLSTFLRAVEVSEIERRLELLENPPVERALNSNPMISNQRVLSAGTVENGGLTGDCRDFLGPVAPD